MKLGSLFSALGVGLVVGLTASMAHADAFCGKRVNSGVKYDFKAEGDVAKIRITGVPPFGVGDMFIHKGLATAIESSVAKVNAKAAQEAAAYLTSGVKYPVGAVVELQLIAGQTRLSVVGKEAVTLDGSVFATLVPYIQELISGAENVKNGGGPVACDQVEID